MPELGVPPDPRVNSYGGLPPPLDQPVLEAELKSKVDMGGGDGGGEGGKGDAGGGEGGTDGGDGATQIVQPTSVQLSSEYHVNVSPAFMVTPSGPLVPLYCVSPMVM